MEKRESSTEEQLRILIADDQPHVRKGLQAMLYLEDDLRIVGIASNGLEAVELAERLRPDVVLMDLHMPHLDGFEAMQRIRSKGLPILMIAMVTRRDPASCRRAELAGAVSVIEKGTADVNLGEIIRSAHQAEVLSRQGAASLVRNGQDWMGEQSRASCADVDPIPPRPSTPPHTAEQ